MPYSSAQNANTEDAHWLIVTIIVDKKTGNFEIVYAARFAPVTITVISAQSVLMT